MLTKEKRRAVLSAAISVVVGIMIITSSSFASMSSSAFASTSSDLFIVSSDSGAEVHTMKLKAVKEKIATVSTARDDTKSSSLIC